MRGAVKYLAGALVVANLALYLWAAGGDGDAAPARPAATATVNADAMRLVHEIAPAGDAPSGGDGEVGDGDGGVGGGDGGVGGGDGGVGGGDGEVGDGDGGVGDGDGEAGDGDISARTGAALEPPAGDSQTRSCHRIGPFKGRQNWAAAAAWMRAQGVDYQAIRSARRTTQVVRVYRGPFATRAAAVAAVAALEAAGLEHFVEADATGAVTISLGYFTQAALAEKYLAHLRARDIDAQSRRAYRDLGPHDWFEATVDAAGRAALAARDWAEASAVVVEVDCRDLTAAGAAAPAAE